MTATITIEDFGMRDMLNALHDALIGQGQYGDAATVVEDEARLFLKQAITITPPRGLGQVARKQGEDAITRDLSKLFTPINADFLNMISGQYGTSGIDAWITDTQGQPKHLKWDRLDPTGAGIKDFHQRNRDARGRVRFKKNRSKDAWYAKYVVSFRDFTPYLQKIISHVGRRKAAWAVSYLVVGGKVQRWIARHLSGAKGRTINQLSVPNHPSITMANFAPGISGDEHIIRSVFRIRMEAMAKRCRLVLSDYALDVARGIRPTRKAFASPAETL